MILIYCYDAYCGWCYGFSSVIRKLSAEYKDEFQIEVLSGGMILPEHPVHISTIAQYVQSAYTRVEELSGVKFGPDYLWHIFNPDKSDWYLNSEKPAIALCILKEMQPDRAVEFATDLQFALHFEGRDLTDDEAYRHLLPKYDLIPEEFYSKLRSEDYKAKAHYEFALVKQLKVNGYPTLLLQLSENKFYMIARGFSNYQSVKKTLDSVLAEVRN